MKRRREAIGLLLGVSATLVGCDSSTSLGAADPGLMAASYAVRDMAGTVPWEVEGEPNRYLTDRWQGPLPRTPVPDEVRVASGLRFASDSVVSTRASTMVVLNLFKPRVFGGDSVVVGAEWLVFPPDEHFWGEDYTYVLRCGKSCTLLNRYGPGNLN